MQKKSSSKKEKKPEKLKLSQEEFEKRVLELAEKGLTSEKIGEELRKQDVHSKEYNKKISKILKEKNRYVIPEIKNVSEKLEKIKKHHEKNKQDKKARRETERTFAKLRKINEYHKIIS